MKDILIVEDGSQERDRLKSVFEEAGYSVVACESVGEAETSLQHEMFRLAVLDIGLNDRSGSYLFSKLKKGGRVSYVIIFTGNPSVHLKQRFMNEGAVDFIVKGSPEAQNDQFIRRVQEVIGDPQEVSSSGIDLEVFLESYLTESSKQLFLDMDDSLPPCRGCGSRQYLVTFSHQTQVPPEVTGLVVCAACAAPMDPEVE